MYWENLLFYFYVTGYLLRKIFYKRNNDLAQNQIMLSLYDPYAADLTSPSHGKIIERISRILINTIIIISIYFYISWQLHLSYELYHNFMGKVRSYTVIVTTLQSMLPSLSFLGIFPPTLLEQQENLKRFLMT